MIPAALGMSLGEILLLAVVAYLVLGPRKLPEMARRAAQIMAELRRANNDFRRSLDREISAIEVVDQPLPSASAPATAAPGIRTAATAAQEEGKN